MHDSFARTARIVGLGGYLPERVLTNHDLEAIVETSDEWITSRTGISERRMVADGEALVDLVDRAGRAALEDAGVDPAAVDLLILATATVEQPIPASAAIVQPRLGLRDEQVFSNVHRVGNTSSASIPLAMVDARDQGRMSRGDLVMTSSFGGGLTWASTLFRY